MPSHLAGSVLIGDNQVTDDMPQEERLRRGTTFMSEDELLYQFTYHHNPEHQDPGNNYVLEPQNDSNGFEDPEHIQRGKM
jgi:hypothetical protein